MKNKFFSFLKFSPLILILCGCAVHTALEPVGREQWNFQTSFGGPTVAAFGVSAPLVPLPFLTSGIRYGLSERIDLTADLHLIPLLPLGMIGLETAVSYYPWLGEDWKPTLALEVRLINSISLKKEVSGQILIFPVLTGSASWEAGRGLFYGGSHCSIPIQKMDFDQDVSALRISPFIGYRFDWTNHFRLFLELKWQAANIRSDLLAVEYASLGQQGALAPFVGIEWDFKK